MRVDYKSLIVIALLAMMPVAAYAATSTDDITTWMRNLETHLPAVLKLLVAASYVMGVCFIVMAIMKLKMFGQSSMYAAQQHSILGPLVYFGVGAMLIYFPSLIDVAIWTFWDYGADYVMGRSVSINSWDGLLQPVVAIVRIIGYISFLRGMLLLARFGQQSAQPGTLGKAIFHLVGGILAVNVLGAWDIVSGTINGAFTG